MTQLFKNAARSALAAPIAAADTSLTVDITTADLFPAANTGTDPVGTVGKDWFKVVLEDVNHNIEIVYVRTRTLGSAVMSNLQRGQEGTTAISFATGSVVGLRMTASDMQDAINLAAQATTQGEDLLWAASVDAQVTKLGSALQKQLVQAFTTAGTSTAYTITPTPAITAYAANLSFDVTFNQACGAAPTLSISGVLTPPNLVKQNPDGTYSNLAAGDVVANHRSRVTLLSATQALVEKMPAKLIARDIQAQTYTAFTTGGTATAFTLTPTPAITSNTAGIEFEVTFNAAAGATPTLAVSGLTALPLRYRDNSGALQAITATQVPSGWVSKVYCDGTYWIVLNPVVTSLGGGGAGQIPYQSAAGTTAMLAAGASTQVLTGGASAPAWKTARVISQIQATQTSAMSTGVNVIPPDDTIPQNTEGDQYMTLSITPVSATSTLVIEVTGHFSPSVNTITTMALFKDTTADALAAETEAGLSSSWPTAVHLQHSMTSGTTSAITFKVRAGSAPSGGILTFNGSAGARVLGGVLASRITITEYLP